MRRWFTAIACLGLTIASGLAQADESKVPLGDVPKAGLEAVKAMFPAAEISGAAKETEDNKTVFEVTLKLRGRTIDVTLGTDGKIQVVEKEIAHGDLPAAVKAALEAKYPKAIYKIVEQVDKMKDGKPMLDFFESLLVTAGLEKIEVQITPDGTIKAEEKKKAGDESAALHQACFRSICGLPAPRLRLIIAAPGNSTSVQGGVMSLLAYLRDPGRIVRKARWSMIRSRRPVELTADTWNGRLTFNSSDGLIGKFLYVRQAYERHYLTHVVEYLDRAGLRNAQRDIVLDVGANIGMIAIALVKHGWFGGAIAFEPEPYNFQLLVRNVRQNGLENVISCRQLALSSAAGEADLVLNEGNLGGHFVSQALAGAAPAGALRASVRIKMATCDAVLAGEFGHLVDRIGLVWMDIEGHEGFFLKGATRTLAAGIPVVSEFYPLAIERSGMSREHYVRLVSELFTHVCCLRDGRFVEQPISAVTDLMDAYDGPGATNVIFVRR